MPRPDRRGPGGPGARSICGSRTAAARTIPTRISCGRPHRRRVFRPQQPKHLRRDGMRCLCGAALRGHSIVWLGGRVSVWSPIARSGLAAPRRRGCKCRGITAEEAGFYKPDPRPYRLALERLGVAAGEAAFVAGSGYDLIGTAAVGLRTYGHNRVGLSRPDGAPPADHESRNLDDLVPWLEGLR